MNLLNHTILPGTIVNVSPNSVADPVLAQDPRFECLGGDGMYSNVASTGWAIRGIWLADGSHGIISSDLIVAVAQVPAEPKEPLTIMEECDWIRPQDCKVHTAQGHPMDEYLSETPLGIYYDTMGDGVDE